jgi:predicted ribosomally synthesized peptide with nif11-like leader
MSRKDLARFCAEYLTQHPELKQRIDARGDRAKLAKGLALAGAEAGYDFSEAEVLEVLTGTARPELSDSELEAVAGGVRKAGEKPLEYMKYTLENVLITSYQTGGSGD